MMTRLSPLDRFITISRGVCASAPTSIGCPRRGVRPATRYRRVSFPGPKIIPTRRGYVLLLQGTAKRSGETVIPLRQITNRDVAVDELASPRRLSSTPKATGFLRATLDIVAAVGFVLHRQEVAQLAGHWAKARQKISASPRPICWCGLPVARQGGGADHAICNTAAMNHHLCEISSQSPLMPMPW